MIKYVIIIMNVFNIIMILNTDYRSKNGNNIIINGKV